MIKPLFRGEIGFTTKIEFVQTVMNQPNVKIIYVGDTLGAENLINYYQMIPGTLLVPEFSAMESDINGSEAEFYQKYYAQLSNEPAFSYLITLLTAMHIGKNILIYIPPESDGLRYPKALAEFFIQRFGIQPGWDNIPYVFNPECVQLVADLLYNFNMIGPIEYLTCVETPSPIVLPKLSFDLAINVNLNDKASVDRFVSFLLQNKENAMQSNKIMTRPFGRRV